MKKTIGKFLAGIITLALLLVIMPSMQNMVFAEYNDYGLLFQTSSGKFFLDVDGNGNFSSGDTEYTGQSGAWSWDSGTSTLTLTDFDWSTPARTALKVLGDVTMNLVGDNMFGSTYHGPEETIGILVKGKLTITGSGELYGESGTSLSDTGYGIWGDEVTINSGIVTAAGNASKTTIGLGATTNILINGGELSATAAGAADNSIGIYALTSVTITGGNVYAFADTAATSRGIFIINAPYTFNISGGLVTAIGETSAFRNAPATLPAAYIWWASNTLPYDIYGVAGTASSDTAYIHNTNQKYVCINANYGLIFDTSAGKFWQDVDGNLTVNAGDIEYTSGAGVTWVWDSGTSTLTLTNFAWKTQARFALTILGDITINLAGSNRFISRYQSSMDTGGIYTDSKLTVEGSGALYAESGSAPSAVYGINAAEFILNSGSVVAFGNTGTSSSGIMAGTVTVNGGKLNTTGKTATAVHGVSGGILVYNDMTITGGTVSATGGTATRSYGIVANESYSAVINISGGSVTAQGNTSAFNIAPAAVPAAYIWWAGTALPYIISSPGTVSSVTPYVWNADQKFVSIEEDTIEYGLIFDTVTGKFWLDIDNSHSVGGADTEYTDQSTAWSWDGSVLKLNGFSYSIGKGYTALMIVGGNLTIELSGDNTFAVDEASGDGLTCGIRADMNINVTITGSGTLNAKGGSSNVYTHLGSGGILIDGGAFNMANGTVNATGGDVGGNSLGICVNGNLAVANGTINANGGTASGEISGGIYVGGITTINGGIVNALGGTASANASCGVHAKNDITISGGTLSATGGAATLGGSYGVFLDSGATLAITGSTLVAAGQTVAINRAPNVSALASYTYWTNNAVSDPGGEGTKVPEGTAYSYNTEHKYLKIASDASSTSGRSTGDSSTGDSSTGDGSTKTGDESMILVWLAAAMLGLAVCVVAVWRNRRAAAEIR